MNIRVREAKNHEEGYDPIQEAIDRKNSIKPPDDLNQKKPKYIIKQIFITRFLNPP